MKKYLLSILALCFIVLISGCIDNSFTDMANNNLSSNVFNGSGIYFQYPSGWEVYGIEDNEIAAVGHQNLYPKVNRFDNGTVELYSDTINGEVGEGITVMRFGTDEVSLKEAINQIKSEQDMNFNITESSIVIDGLNATLFNYTAKTNNTTFKGSYVIFEKNGYVYTVDYSASPTEDYKEEVFKDLINSFRVI